MVNFARFTSPPPPTRLPRHFGRVVKCRSHRVARTGVRQRFRCSTEETTSDVGIVDADTGLHDGGDGSVGRDGLGDADTEFLECFNLPGHPLGRGVHRVNGGLAVRSESAGTAGVG